VLVHLKQCLTLRVRLEALHACLPYRILQQRCMCQYCFLHLQLCTGLAKLGAFTVCCIESMLALTCPLLWQQRTWLRLPACAHWGCVVSAAILQTSSVCFEMSRMHLPGILNSMKLMAEITNLYSALVLCAQRLVRCCTLVAEACSVVCC
jgi:hypothetical protein